jgi:hypothetical protein
MSALNTARHVKSTAPDELDVTLDEAKLREQAVRAAFNGVRRAGEKWNRAGIAVGKACHASAGVDKVREASGNDITVGISFALLLDEIEADVLRLLAEAGVSMVRRGERSERTEPTTRG